MRYVMLFHMHNEAVLSEEANQKCFKEMMRFIDELKARDSLVFDSQILQTPPGVHLPSTSGLETRGIPELGGFFVIDVPTHEVALEIATRCPHRQVGGITIYPLNESQENAYVGT